MKILWVKTDFLHPTTRGGQIRTLGMLRALHARHEIHYVAFDFPGNPEGPARSAEYCSQAYPVPHRVPVRTSPAFALQLAAGLFSPLPVSISRYRSSGMRSAIQSLLRQHRFDAVVCDFLFPAPNLPDLSGCVLFQHNVETMIWKRHAEHAPDPLRKAFFQMEARRMQVYEGRVCREARRVIAVSQDDADTMRRLYGLNCVPAISTGVDVEYFTPPAAPARKADLVFVGSMDWMANIDGVTWFVEEVLPLIRRRRPDCSLAVAGRRPVAAVSQLAARDPLIQVTGTVADVRPWLFGALVSIVPLRIGGGTRLKIYESMAAGVPVVSTTVGAEGLEARDGQNILLADAAARFADRCLCLLESEAERRRLAEAGREMVLSRYSWEAVAREFERLLDA
jgi:sugar transferase (PEP-CTERM/EpsH1 system associated)